ncbi:hypothetical protein AB4393_12285 [Vibrio splendidus]|uniref:hypothetical protein n=1 Tax=Vibrio splendidus TaxID=29497 RepID=UPI000C83ADFB|nr:hypothetical protein [Vibrio splendidus]PMG37143.1 hypothetical protein BCU97_11740 [Vibrio splendidus]
MKKLAITTAVLASLAASSAFAEVTVDIYGDRTTNKDFANADKATQGVVIGYSPIENLDFDAEVTTDKDLDLGVAYKFELGSNFYLKPQMGYVIESEDGYKASTGKFANLDPIKNRYDQLHLNIPNSNVMKAGLETGANFGEFFTSVRYRIEMDTSKNKLTATGPKSAGKVVSDDLVSETSRIGRTDLLIGYHFDAVTLTAKAIHKTQLNKDIRKINDALNDFDKFADTTPLDVDKLGTSNSSWTSEVKATLTSYSGVAPYVQYAHNHDSKDNQIKLGAKFSF